MKILILANNDVGLFQFRRELIEELLKEHEVTIALPAGKLIEPFIEAGCSFIDTPFERRGMNPIKDFNLFSKYLRFIKQEKPEFIITYTIKPNIYGGLAARLLKVPHAVNITGLGTAFENKGLLRAFVAGLYKVSLRKAKVVFFENSDNQQLFIGEKIIHENQACLLPGAGVNLEHYQVTEYPCGDETKFLFVGRVMKEKGIEELFSAMKMLIEEGYKCSLDVVGGLEEDYSETIKKYEAEGWLHYQGYQEDVRPFYDACHCFALPSWHEGMANTNLECAASGRPVITSNIPGCKEAVIDGVSGILCEPRHADSLYDAMKKMIKTASDDRSLMGKAGRKHMKDVFDKKKVVAETINHLF